jgi:peroxiredoxin
MRTMLLLVLPVLAYAQNVTGRWDGVVTADDVKVPFHFDLAQSGAKLQGTLYDGPITYKSDAGSFENGKLHLHWNIYNSNLDATFTDGAIDGLYVTRRSNTKLLTKPLHATRYAAPALSKEVPSIAGAWTLKANDDDPKHVWTITITQSGAAVSGAIQRLDGDSGTLTGTVSDGKFVMSHFSGIRPAVMRGTLVDGHLDITYNDKMKMTGMRPDEARAKGIVPADPKQFTRVKDPNERFRFTFPDLAGKPVSESDERFRGKVVLVNITGSWCPNCNDDAPFLQQLYRKYRAAGLEIVGLSYESGDIDYDRVQVKEFITRNRVTYPILLAGTTDNVASTLPFVLDFAGFPTTFFLGRDGKVKTIHDGFAGVGVGAAHTELEEETEALVRKLLAEKPPPLSSKNVPLAHGRRAELL